MNRQVNQKRQEPLRLARHILDHVKNNPGLHNSKKARLLNATGALRWVADQQS